MLTTKHVETGITTAHLKLFGFRLCGHSYW